MSDKKRLFKSAAAGAVCGLLASVALMCAAAMVLLKLGLLGNSALDLMLTVILGLGAAAGGFVAAKLNRGAGLIAGAITGAVMLTALTLISLLNGQAEFSALFLFKLLACVLGGCGGGLLAVREKKRIRL